jgi:hypothetical protein
MNFKKSAFPMITFNCGPDTEAFEHTDGVNAAGKLCWLTALSNHDATKGGHIVLYNLGLYIQFPPGSTIGLPSSTVPHGNTPIASNETRYSITQYCPGGLLRWVHYGFQSVKSLKAQPGGAKKMAELDRPFGDRAKWALDRFSKVDELQNDRVRYS